MSSHSITVLYFASAREATKGQISSESVRLDAPSISVSKLKSILIDTHGKTLESILKTCAVSVEQEYSESDEDVIRSGNEVEIIPPISGG